MSWNHAGLGVFRLGRGSSGFALAGMKMAVDWKEPPKRRWKYQNLNFKSQSSWIHCFLVKICSSVPWKSCTWIVLVAATIYAKAATASMEANQSELNCTTESCSQSGCGTSTNGNIQGRCTFFLHKSFSSMWSDAIPRFLKISWCVLPPKVGGPICHGADLRWMQYECSLCDAENETAQFEPDPSRSFVFATFRVETTGAPFGPMTVRSSIFRCGISLEVNWPMDTNTVKLSTQSICKRPLWLTLSRSQREGRYRGSSYVPLQAVIVCSWLEKSGKKWNTQEEDLPGTIHADVGDGCCGMRSLLEALKEVGGQGLVEKWSSKEVHKLKRSGRCWKCVKWSWTNSCGNCELFVFAFIICGSLWIGLEVRHGYATWFHGLAEWEDPSTNQYDKITMTIKTTIILMLHKNCCSQNTHGWFF